MGLPPLLIGADQGTEPWFAGCTCQLPNRGQWSSGRRFPLIPFAVVQAARDIADLTGRWLRARVG